MKYHSHRYKQKLCSLNALKLERIKVQKYNSIKDTVLSLQCSDIVGCTTITIPASKFPKVYLWGVA